MHETERVLKALANRRRLALFTYLRRHHEATVGELATSIKLSLKATSKHLAILASVGVLEREQRSVLAYYSLARPLPRVVQALNHIL